MIKPGDMVMVIWGCCEPTRKYIGTTWSVTSIVPPYLCRCAACGHEVMASVHLDINSGGHMPVSWLIKLDPPTVTTEKREEVEV